jgi:hypothetical protein
LFLTQRIYFSLVIIVNNTITFLTKEELVKPPLLKKVDQMSHNGERTGDLGKVSHLQEEHSIFFWQMFHHLLVVPVPVPGPKEDDREKTSQIFFFRGAEEQKLLVSAEATAGFIKF